MAETINTELFLEAWEKEMCLWDVNSVIFKKPLQKSEEQKKLAEQFSVLVLVLASYIIQVKVLPTLIFFSFSSFFS